MTIEIKRDLDNQKDILKLSIGTHFLGIKASEPS